MVSQLMIPALELPFKGHLLLWGPGQGENTASLVQIAGKNAIKGTKFKPFLSFMVSLLTYHGVFDLLLNVILHKEKLKS